MLGTFSFTYGSTRPNAFPEDGKVTPDGLRTLFAASLSQMYRNEVPQYGDLVQIVRQVNEDVLGKSKATENDDSAERISLERHGAIRLGTAHELQTIRRIFSLMGMYPVDYYDLSVAGLPMHATAFRPVDAASLARNPFRVFTTLLREELLTDESSRILAHKLLTRRQIFSPKLMDLLEGAESAGGCLTVDQVEVFISEALLTFRWRSTAASTDHEYEQLSSEHPILADIACFQSAHINHLTPRTLNIDAAYASMQAAGLAVKDSIEGPPRRLNPILLRQTSFLALQEPVQFPAGDSTSSGTMIHGHHKARFGEIEERGAAVTPKGRSLYNDLVQEAVRQADSRMDAKDKAAAYAQVFSAFPDDHERRRAQRLIYCIYECTRSSDAFPCVGEVMDADVIDRLVQQGVLSSRTITYEDFLPFSAAGIFRSNLQRGSQDSSPRAHATGCPDLQGFEQALGSSVHHSDSLYQAMERRSLQQCAETLGLRFEVHSHV